MSSVWMGRFAAVAMAILALGVQTAALSGALDWFGRVTPKVLVDPDLLVSDIGLPDWEGPREGLRFPDRVSAVEGSELHPLHGELRARAFDRAIAEAAALGRPSVRLRVEREGKELETHLVLAPLEPIAWWLWAGAMFLLAWLYVGTALVALVTSPTDRLARTFAKTAGFCAMFLLALFDFHTTRALVPLFEIAFAMVPIYLFVLALRLPDDVGWLARRPWLVHLFEALGGALALALVATRLTGGTTVVLRNVCTILLGAAFIGFGATLLVRFLRATGERRVRLRGFVVATAPVHALVGAGLVLAALGLTGATTLFLLTPILASTPLVSVAAFVRHDIWRSGVHLSRPITRAVITSTAIVFGGAIGAFAATMAGEALRSALFGSALGAIVTVGLSRVFLGGGDRLLFPSRAQYKPTIEQLSQELKELQEPTRVARSIERTVRRWLPCDQIEVTVFDPPRERIANDSPLAPGQKRLVLPISIQDRELARLDVGEKRGGALFTSEDVDLLRTVTNQAALALAYARSYAELEALRAEEKHAWRGERDALIRTAAAEVAHEVRIPINFLRMTFPKQPAPVSLDAEDVELVVAEVERLERLAGRLRHLTRSRDAVRRSVVVEELVQTVALLLQDRLRELRFSVHVAPGSVLRGDRDQLVQILTNLVANAADAAGPGGRVGVELEATDGGARLVVWDDGPGFGDDVARLFTPWYTTKEDGSGLGLAITSRFVRAHGWTIDARRVDDRTRFEIAIPEVDRVELRSAS